MKMKKILSWLLSAIVLLWLWQLVNAWTISIVPEASTITKDCPVKVDVMMDTQWDEVNSVDFAILANDTYEINEVNTKDNVVFRTYWAIKSAIAREWKFKWKKVFRLVATSASKKWYKWTWKLLTLTVTPKTDKLDLEIYMVKNSAWDDTNMAIVKDWKASDVLSDVKNLNVITTEWQCTVSKLAPLTLEEPKTTVLSEKVKEVSQETTEVNKENTFDTMQKMELLKEKWLYILIIIVAIVLLWVLFSKKKSKKSNKETKKSNK